MTELDTDYAWLFGRQQRPTFHDAAEYLAHVTEAVRIGRDFWHPSNPEELAALGDKYPERAKRYRRHAQDWGFPARWPDPPAPFGDEWQERFLATLKSDEEFRIAVRHYLGVA